LVALLAIASFNNVASFVSLTDLLGNSYSQVESQSQNISDGSGNTLTLSTSIYLAGNTPSGSNAITAKWNTTGAAAFLTIYEISGLGTSPATDQVASATGTSFPPSFSIKPNSNSTIALANFLYFFGNFEQAASGGTGWTLDTPASNFFSLSTHDFGGQSSEHQILSSNSAISAALLSPSSGENWVGCACTLTNAAAPPSGGTYPHWISTQMRDTARHR
jgi:hypothetical protein